MKSQQTGRASGVLLPKPWTHERRYIIPLELLVQLLARENQLRGPAVGAMVRIVDRVPLLQKRGDLRRREPVAGLDRRFAGHRVQHVVQQVAAIGLSAAGNQPFQSACRTRRDSCSPASPENR